MAKLVQKSGYIQSDKAGGYMKYIATREGVEKLSGNGPVTKGQRELIQKLLHDFPDAAELFEYEDYCKTPTLGTASAFITMALDAKKYSARTVYSLRDLKTREDWNEWQANVLGAAILMPQKEIDLAMWYFAGGKKLINYEGVFAYRDKLSLSLLCRQFAVSKSAAVIRLRHLGYIEDRPYREYSDPLEVWA